MGLSENGIPQIHWLIIIIPIKQLSFEEYIGIPYFQNNPFAAKWCAIFTHSPRCPPAFLAGCNARPNTGRDCWVLSRMPVVADDSSGQGLLKVNALVLSHQHGRMQQNTTICINMLRKKQDAAHEPECSHVQHFCNCKKNYLNSLVHVSHATVPVQCRLWNVEKGGVQSVECGVSSVECGVWSAQCRVPSLNSRVKSVECKVWSVKCKV